MRERDLDLIAALVEGRLEDETEARALIESSSNHRAEYEAQRLAYETMSAVSPARLTDHERAALRRDVWTELQARPASVEKTSPWYLRWSYAAAGVLVLVGLGAGAISMLNDGELALTAADTAEESADLLQGGEGGATATTEAASAILEDDAGADAADGAAQTVPPDASFFLNKADDTRSGALDDSAEEDLAARHADCLESAGLIEYETVGQLEVENPEELGLEGPGSYLVAVPAGVEIDEDTPVAFVDAATCELTHLDE